VILYMPTFRVNNAGYVSPLSDERVLSILRDNNWLWVEKKHGEDADGMMGKVENQTVLQLDSDFDANVLLPHVDMIVTDYSSVSWDALYHKKPILFYMPDYDYYMNQDRGFVLGPEEFIIGPAAYTIEEFAETLQKYREDFLKMLPENEEAIFKKVWGQETNCASIWEKIVQKCRIN
ncbi:MAG: CDP-glycerol glycerophosphotransferase family protein, partial [Agathobacter sp.]|nr:CDP-glycerol glycerophosphotransferase family protein [Agathobacter sp.]